MKYQFNEGDGSHRDMTIEECNLVLDRLRKQGYNVQSMNCNVWINHFWFVDEMFATCYGVESFCNTTHNEIPFERWMEILDENEKPNVKIEMGISGIVTEHLPKDLRQKAIISELKEVVSHIPEHQLAGFPEKMRKLVIELTKL